jgi:hypothetical protein
MNMKKIAVLLITMAVLLSACGDGNFIEEPTALPLDITTPPTEENEPEIRTPAIFRTAPYTITPTPEPDIPDNSLRVYGDFEYQYQNWLEGMGITRYLGEELDVVIPSEIDNYPVVSIERFAFRDAGINSLYIPDSVKSISGILFDGNENMTVSFRGRTFTDKDERDVWGIPTGVLNGIHVLDNEHDSDMINAWNELGEWDVSDFIILIDDGVVSYNWVRGTHNVFVISRDGTVKGIEFNFMTIVDNEYISMDNWYYIFKDVVLKSVRDDSLPVLAQVDEIPDDIIESVKTLGLSKVDYSQMFSTGYSGTGILLVVGSGENTHLINIGRRGGSWTLSFDEVVNELYERIDEWFKEQRIKPNPPLYIGIQ